MGGKAVKKKPDPNAPPMSLKFVSFAVPWPVETAGLVKVSSRPHRSFGRQNSGLVRDILSVSLGHYGRPAYTCPTRAVSCTVRDILFFQGNLGWWNIVIWKRMVFNTSILEQAVFYREFLDFERGFYITPFIIYPFIFSRFIPPFVTRGPSRREFLMKFSDCWVETGPQKP